MESVGNNEKKRVSSTVHYLNSPPLSIWAANYARSGGKKYEIIVGIIQSAIADGILLPGMRLPTQRVIASHFGVTIATITKAINLAAHQGIVNTRAGSGTFIATPTVEYATLPTEADLVQGYVDLSLNAPPISITQDILRDGLKEMAGEPDAGSIFDYEPIPGSLKHKKAGKYWFSLRGINVPAEQILITHGAHEGLIVALLALAKPGDCVLCESLNYTGLRRIGQMLNIYLVPVELDDEGLIVDSLPDLIKKHQPKALICTPVVQNPTTITLPIDRRIKLIRIAKSYGLPIVEDDIYGLFAESQFAPIATLWPEGTILITSLSKTIAPGLRVGFIAAAGHMVGRLRDAMFMLGWTEPSLQIGVATRLIETGKAEECLRLHRKEAAQRMQYAREIFGDAMLTKTATPTYHIWVSTGAVSSTDIAAELARKNILVSPASHFNLNSHVAPNALRISLGRIENRELLISPLKKVAQHLLSRHTAGLGSIV